MVPAGRAAPLLRPLPRPASRALWRQPQPAPRGQPGARFPGGSAQLSRARMSAAARICRARCLRASAFPD